MKGEFEIPAYSNRDLRAMHREAFDEVSRENAIQKRFAALNYFAVSGLQEFVQTLITAHNQSHAGQITEVREDPADVGKNSFGRYPSNLTVTLTWSRLHTERIIESAHRLRQVQESLQIIQITAYHNGNMRIRGARTTTVRMFDWLNDPDTLDQTLQKAYGHPRDALSSVIIPEPRRNQKRRNTFR